MRWWLNFEASLKFQIPQMLLTMRCIIHIYNLMCKKHKTTEVSECVEQIL